MTAAAPAALRVALVNPPSPRLCLRDYFCAETAKGDYLWPPLDLLVLSGLLYGRAEILVVDALCEELDEAAFGNRLADFRPDAVVSLVAGFRLAEDLALLARLRTRLGFRLVITGDSVFYAPLDVARRFPWVDGLLVDFMDPRVRDFLASGEAVPCVLEPARMPADPPRKTAPVRYPLPRHELFPLARYRLELLAPRGTPITSVLTNYGCPYACRYCALPAMPYSERPLDDVIEEWTSLAEEGIGGIFVRDMTFGASRGRVLELCARLEALGNRIPWICEVKLEALDEDVLSAMRRAGCRTICFGVESSDERLLRGLWRRADNARLARLARHCSAIGLATLAHYVVGLPGRSFGGSILDVAKMLAFPVDHVSWNRYVPREGSSLRAAGETASGGELDVSGGTGWPRAVAILATLAFYLRPDRAYRLLRAVGSSGFLPQARVLWTRMRAPR